MEQRQATDDLRAIRQVMARTRQATKRYGGEIMIVWGVAWFLGFVGTHLFPALAHWIWIVVNGTGMILTVWLAAQASRRDGVRSGGAIWRLIAFWWLSLGVFDGLLVWLLGLDSGIELSLLIVLTIALGYVQFGLFTHWLISIGGLLLAASGVIGALLGVDYFNLVVGISGGIVLGGGGLLFKRLGNRQED
ncbi:MAG TPA: hypothetical protein ENN19_01875 [Chloroflexi bacterium]|nr:hypothetical protein [Chloroflexota bacterium]